MVNSRIPNGPWKRWKKSRSREDNFATREVQDRTACRRLCWPAHDGETFKLPRSTEREPSRPHIVDSSSFVCSKSPGGLFFLQFFSSGLLEIRFSGNKNFFRFISEYFLSSRVTIPELLASDALNNTSSLERCGFRGGWVVRGSLGLLRVFLS